MMMLKAPKEGLFTVLDYIGKQTQGNLFSLHIVSALHKGQENVLMLSSIQSLLGITMDDEKEKPAIIKLSDFPKGGTDVANQKRRSSQSSPKV